jgi:prenylcysteine alpha-carboxyl methylesterase
LIIFAILLMPGFIQVIMFYYTSSRVRRGVAYGSKPRNRLDIYVPDCAAVSPRPVVIYVTGGAWIIGYKAWGALLAQRLSEAGVVVCCLDYRNFPQGTILDMMEDINTAFGWIAHNVINYSGDPTDISVVGQSAGAQLAALALLFQANSCSGLNPALERHTLPWDLGCIRGFVGISGAYNIPDLATHLDERGLHRSLFERIMAVNEVTSLESFSPLHVLAASPACLRTTLPLFRLIHGEADRSVPIAVAAEFAFMLKAQGISTTLDVCIGKSHTQLMIEDSLRGGQDHTLEQILEAMGHKHVQASYRALAPPGLVDLASWVCPF